MKRIIFVSALVLMLCVTIFAQASDIQNVYFQDFGITDDVSQNVTPAGNNSFSAQVIDGALHMKTDSLCFFRANGTFENISAANSADNSKGLTYYNKDFYTGYKLDEPQDIVHTDKKTYRVNYKVDAGGSNALLLDEVEGITAIGFHTFNNQDRTDRPVNTTDVKFNVAPGLFSSTDNTVTFRFTVFAEQKGAPLNMTYIKPDGKQSTRTLFTIGESDVGVWHTKEVTLSDIDLTALISQDSGAALQQYAFRMNTILGYDLYLHSIEIIGAEKDFDRTIENNTYKVKINENPLYGDVKLSYDLEFPSSAVCVDDVCGDGCVEAINYNTGKNRMTVNIINQNDVEIATVVYDIDGDNGIVSVEHTDENGQTVKQQVYEGSFYDRKLRYVIGYKMTDGVFNLDIYDGDELVSETSDVFDIKNKDLGVNTFVQYFSFAQNRLSDSLCVVIDNISVNFAENVIYKGMVEDIKSIELPDIVRGDFTLPSTGSMNGSSISWSSENPDVIFVDGYEAIVSRDANENKKAVLTARISDGMFSVDEKFEVSAKALKGEFADCFSVEEKISGDNIIAATTVKNAGRSGAAKIRFMAVSYKNGEIFDRAVCEKDVSGEYEGLDFEVTVKKGDNIKYYVWDENNVSLINNAPYIKNAKFESKILGAVVKWEKAFDDFDAVESYVIERSDGRIFVTDGEEYGENMLRFFDSEAVENTVYNYTLSVMDTNQKESEAISGKAKKINMPYSMYLTSSFSADGTYDGGNHISFIYRSDSDRAAYTENSAYEGEQCMFIPSGKYAAFVTDLSDVSENIVVRFTYASSMDTRLKFMYNGKQPDGSFAEVSEAVKAYPATDGWQTVDFVLDKEFKSGGTFTGGLFGLGCSSPNGVYLKKVEFVKMQDYE